MQRSENVYRLWSPSKIRIDLFRWTEEELMLNDDVDSFEIRVISLVEVEISDHNIKKRKN